jgi:hypothetical protein
MRTADRCHQPGAGLVETRRDGRAVRHSFRDLGKQLVSAREVR